MNLHFPMRIDFDLSKVRNIDNPTSIDSVIELAHKINKSLNHRFSDTQTLTSSSQDISLSNDYNIAIVKSVGASRYIRSQVNIEDLTDTDSDIYYLSIDSNRSSVDLQGDVYGTTTSYNRSLFVLREVGDSVVILKEFKDMYIEEEGDFDMQDFVGWDLNI